MEQDSPKTDAQTVPNSGEQTGIQPGLADRAEAVEAANKAEEALGQVGTGRVVHTDSSGIVLSDREVADVQAHGNQEDSRI
ncbi:hypothetical protein A3A68_01400 [Candidatus Saccharibacteria bacterium RIFCSPLOWO2_01_FULL_48_13]|nr:MAG: hypothetical protein A2884_00315 [Candidatus Saccharibacteria bacterium RIFCSPHIGHO2_01_FULL_48_12]OGL36790.1 MAG: hypothetical protein A3F38_02580 [Candidatus Saccharibacteria bacterium RIFCSPHIGHO2_12_FULL_48_21]OGL37369.1 MAG: hypothetical protein A3A68_01400 [Candidatus Saccharibacteria bacterium RIFCSPLOWO2_01_FULL_48_13]